MKMCRKYIIPCAIIICLLGINQKIKAGSEFGLPGDDFSAVKYPLEDFWKIESNPAYLAISNKKAIGASFLPGFESSSQSSIHFYMPINSGIIKSSGFGFILRHHSLGDINGRGPNGEELGSFSFSKSQLVTSFGRQLANRLYSGISAKIIYFTTSIIDGLSLSNISKTAFGMDYGIYYRVDNNIELGLSMINFPFQPDITLKSVEEKLPLIVHFDGNLVLSDGEMELSGGLDYIKNEQRNGNDVIRPEGGVNYLIQDILLLGIGYANDGVIGGVRVIYNDISIQYSLKDTDLGFQHYTALNYYIGNK